MNVIQIEGLKEKAVRHSFMHYSGIYLQTAYTVSYCELCVENTNAD
jgi:hypothetical protein